MSTGESNVGSNRRFWTLLGLIMLVGLSGRTAYASSHRSMPVNGDSYAYHGGANLLADGKGYIDPYRYRDQHKVWQTADHPPLYILYLAAWSSVGVDTPTGHRLASVLIGTATIALVALAARRWFTPNAGLVAAGIVAINPNFWFYDGSLHAETVAQCTAAALLWAAAVMVDRPRLRSAVVLGVVAGLAALSRSELLAMIPLVAVPCAAGWVRRRESLEREPIRSRLVATAKRTNLRLVVAAVVASLIVMAPWVAYNESRFEVSAPLGNGYGITLLSGNCDLTYSGQFMAYWAKPCVDASVARVEATGVDQSQLDQAMRQEGFDYISAHKGRFLVVSAARVARVFGFFRPNQTRQLEHFPDGREVIVANLGSAAWYLFASLAVLGAVVARRRGAPLSPFVAPYLAVAAAVFTTVATTRYRSIVEVPTAMLAGYALVRLSSMWIERRATRLSSPASDTQIDQG